MHIAAASRCFGALRTGTTTAVQPDMIHSHPLGVLAIALTLAACSTPPPSLLYADGFIDARAVGPSAVLYTDGPEVRIWANGVTHTLPDPFDASVLPNPAWVGGADDAIVVSTETVAEWDGIAWRHTDVALGEGNLGLDSALRCGDETWAVAFAPGSGEVRLFVRRDATFVLVPNPTDALGVDVACHDGHVTVASVYHRFLRVDGAWSEIEDATYAGDLPDRTVDGRVVFVERLPNLTPDGDARGEAQITLTTWEELERIDTVYPLPLDGHNWDAPSDPDLAFDFSDVEVVLGPNGNVWIAVIDRSAAEQTSGGSGSVWSGPGGGGGRDVDDTRAVIYRWVEGGWSEVAVLPADESGFVELRTLVALTPGELARMGDDVEGFDVRVIAAAR